MIIFGNGMLLFLPSFSFLEDEKKKNQIVSFSAISPCILVVKKEVEVSNNLMSLRTAALGQQYHLREIINACL